MKYAFTLRCLLASLVTCLALPALADPEIAVEQPPGTDIAHGGSKGFGDVPIGTTSTLIFTIKNTGTSDLADLTIDVDGADAGLFQVTANPTAPVAGPAGSTTFTVEFSPVDTGMKTADLHINNNDGDENPFDITLTGTGTAPEIVVEQPLGTDVASGGSRDFGTVLIGGSGDLVFTIFNTGNANLTDLTINIDGVDAALFDIAVDPTAPVAGPAGSTTFTARFTPVDEGAATATLHIASNDDDEDPFDIVLNAVGAHAGAGLAFDGSDDAVEIPAHVDFSTPTFTVEAWVKPGSGMTDWARIWGTENNQGDLIAKTGSQRLFSFAPVINGAHVFATATTAWEVDQWYHVAGVVDATTVRLFVDGVQVAATPYTGAWAGDAGKRYIGKSVSPSRFKGVVDEVRHWSLARNCDQIAQARSGELTGAESGLVAYYRLNQGYADMDNALVTTTVDATGNGNTGTLQNFALSDGNSTSNWTTPGGVTSGVLAPTPVFAEIDVSGNGTPILHGDTTPSDLDHTDFGIPDAEVTRTYTVENPGNLDLTVTDITFTGPFAGDFSLNGSIGFPAIIPGGGSASFSVTVPADMVHVRKVTVAIENLEDCDEGTFEFVIQSAPPIEITTSGGAIVATDSTDAGGTLSLLEPAADFVNFTNPVRSFRIDGVVVQFGDSGPISLTGITSVTMNGNSGSETLNVGGFSEPFPNLTVNGGMGEDAVNLTGSITFDTGRSLNLDLQNDHATPGADSVSLSVDADMVASGAGTITVRASKSVSLAAGSSLVVANGNLIVEANQQGVSSAGTFSGISLAGGTIQTIGTGTVTLSGKGGTTGAGNSGVHLSSGAVVSSASAAAGAGTITISGTGGAGTSNLSGVALDGTASDPSITSARGAIHVTGTGGDATGLGSRGVYLNAGGSITGSGLAAVTVTGFGGTNGTNLRNGIQVSGSGSLISAVNGAVTLAGTGGTGGSGSNNRGVTIDGGAVTATGIGSISITGTEGAGTAAFEGIGLAGPGSTVATSAGSGSISLITDRLIVDSVNADIDAGTQTINIRPRTAGRAVSLGGTDSETVLGLLDNELDRMTAAVLNIGNAATGNIGQIGPINRAAATAVNLTTGGAITITGNTLNSGGGNVTFNAGNLISAPGVSVDVDAGAGTLSFGGARQLAFEINAAVVNVGYDQLNVAGVVDLTGTSLVLSGGYTPLKGQTYVLVNNDGADPVTGAFAGYPEGSLVTFNGVPLAISYEGGTGNDVTLAYAAPVLTAVKSTMTVAEGGTATNNGTFSDLQDDVVSITSNIGMVVPNLGGGTWTWSYTPTNGPAGPITVTVTATDGSTPPLSSTITFTVNVTNVAPVAVAQTVTVLEDSGANVITLGATDAGADTLTYQIVTPPAAAKGSLGVVSGNTVSLTPALNATGAASFTFKAVDNDGASSNTATVTLAITPVNDAPAFVAGPYRAHLPHTSAVQNAIGWATGITDSDAEAVQSLNFIITRVAGLPGLFTTEPTITSAGLLSYQPNGTSGWARFTAVLHDNGGTANGGVDSSAPQLFTIRIGHEQVINFGALADKTYEDPPFELSATGGASGQPVTFAVVSGPATISGTEVTIIGAGVVTIRASQASLGDYAQAEDVDQSFTVHKAPQAITFENPGAHIFGEAPFALTATGGNSMQPVTFQVVSGPATVSGNMLTLTGIGNVTVRANQAGNANYLPAPHVDETFASEAHSDYTVIAWDTAMRVYDNSGNGDTLIVTEPSAGSIRFAAAGRTFSVDGGGNISGNSGNVSLGIATSITLFAAGGSDTITFNAFATALPSLTINGGTGDDTVNLNGDMTFTANSNLDVDLQNDDASPGVDSFTMAANANVATSGIGGIVVRVSRSVSMLGGASLDTVNGNLTVEANQQVVPTTGSFAGVTLNGGAVRSNGTGTVTVKGKGGNAAAGIQFGVRLLNGGIIKGGSNLETLVQGEGGGSTGASNFGVHVASTGTSIHSGGSAVRVIGIEGGGPSGIAISVLTGSSITSPGAAGTLTFLGNSMHFDTTATITATSAVTLKPLTAGTEIKLGLTTNAIGGPLSLTDTELDRVTTGVLNIGDVASGDITVLTAITRAAATAVNLLGAGNITFTSGPFNTGGGNLLLNGGGVSPAFAGVDVATGAGTLSFGAGDALAIGIDSAVVNSGYHQLNLAGLVNLSGATLSLSGSHVPQAGQLFTIIDNNNADAVTGTFAGLPEGATLMFNGVELQISYVGGTGNDVTLGQAAPAITVNNASRTVNEGSTATNAGTFIDVQGNNTVTITANVGSVIKDDLAGTWSWSLTPANVSTTVTITATDNSVPPHVNTVDFALISNNLAPTAIAHSVTVLEDSGATPIALPATDPGSDPLTYSIVTSVPPAKGTLTPAGGNVFNFTPAPDTSGATSFTFKATDDVGAASAVATASITVAPVNDAPSFVIGPDKTHLFGTTAQQAFVGWATSVNDGDSDLSQTLTFNVTEIGSSGIFTTAPAINASGGLTYRPNGSAGTATLSVTLSDNGGTANSGVDTSPPQIFTITVTNSFTAGSYTGLATPEIGTTPAQGNLGLFSGTLATTGVFTGKVNFGGTFKTFTAIFDDDTGNASGTNGTTLTYDLHIDLSGVTDKITGTVTQLSSGDVSEVDADLDIFDAGNHVPDQFLKNGDNTKNGIYTVVFPARASQVGLTTSDYPQGYGYGTITVTPIGGVSITGALADGTTVTASAPLSQSFAWPLAVIIKSTATVTGMTMGGMLQFDTSQADTDVTGVDLQWFRPAKAGAPYYPGGWSSGILIDAIGAKHNLPSGSSVLPGLAAPDPAGNATLEFLDGLLPAPITKDLNIATNNLITKIPTSDGSYTFTLTTTTGVGVMGGSFTHPGHATLKPLIKGTILQKGANTGGYGFFLSPVPSGSPTPGESGGITLMAK